MAINKPGWRCLSNDQWRPWRLLQWHHPAAGVPVRPEPEGPTARRYPPLGAPESSPWRANLGEPLHLSSNPRLPLNSFAFLWQRLTAIDPDDRGGPANLTVYRNQSVREIGIFVKDSLAELLQFGINDLVGKVAEGRNSSNSGGRLWHTTCFLVIRACFDSIEANAAACRVEKRLYLCEEPTMSRTGFCVLSRLLAILVIHRPRR